jgi:hypothetical protein
MAELTENIKENNMLKNQILDIERKSAAVGALVSTLKIGRAHQGCCSQRE